MYKKKSNIVSERIIRDFGLEWQFLDQSKIPYDEKIKIFNKYFSIFPWHYISKNSVGFDAGCGSGRDTKFFLEKGYSVVAFDNSPNMVRHAAELTGQKVLLLSFEEIEFKEMFDGIWACASVLHVPENNISTVLSKFTAALKDDGILYTSFKYGEKEQIRNGRFFADYTEERFNQLLAAIPQLELFQYWKTSDLRLGRSDEKWLNILLKRIISA